MYYHDICGAKLENIDNIEECPECLCPLNREHISPIPDGCWVKAISTDENFMKAMTELYEKDPIEYQLKISQFKTQVKQQEQAQESKREEENTIHCPYCNSTNVKKITTTSKAVHTAIFGIFSMGRNSKQWHCNKCKSDF